MRTLLLPLMLAIAGCGPPVDRVRGGDSAKVLADLKRLEATLPPEDAAAFGKAYRVLLGITVLEHQDDVEKMQHAIRRKFNGKSVPEMLAEYESLDLATRLRFAADDESGSSPAQAAGP